MKMMGGFALALAVILVFSAASIAFARVDGFGGDSFTAEFAPYTVTEPEPYAPYTAGPVVREEFRPYAPYTAGPVVPTTEPYAPYTAGPVVPSDSEVTVQYMRIR